MNKKQIIENCLLELHALGLLSNQEIRELENLILEDKKLMIEFIEIQNTLQKYAHVYAIRPEKHLEKNILKSIENYGCTDTKDEIEYKSENNANVYDLMNKLKKIKYSLRTLFS